LLGLFPTTANAAFAFAFAASFARSRNVGRIAHTALPPLGGGG
jgi:hypothetical protein